MLRDILVEDGVVMAALTETHLKPEILDAEVAIEGYHLYRSDRAGTIIKGGVAIYLKDELTTHCRVLGSGSCGNIEYLVLHIKSHDLVIANVYRPPTSLMQDFSRVITSLKEALSSLDGPEPNLIVCGDFNFPRTDWEAGETTGGHGEERQQASLMIDFGEDLMLNQLIDGATRGENVLDLVFVNNEDLILNVNIIDTVMSDHRILILKTVLGFPPLREGYRCDREGFDDFNFYKENVNWDNISRDISLLNWNEELAGDNVEEMYSILRRKILNICTAHVPRRKNRRRQRKGNQIPRDRKILMRRRAKWVKRLHSGYHDIERARSEIIDLEDQLSQSHMLELSKREEEAINAIKINPKFFYDYAKSKSTIRSGIGPLVDELGNPIDDAGEISEILKSQYESVFSTPRFTAEQISEIGREAAETNELGPVLRDIVLRQEDFVKAARDTRSNSAAGPDGVPAIFIKKTIEALAEPLCLMWKKSLETGRIPSALKLGKITPVYKGGDKTFPKNYRPIVLTSHLIKLFEKIIVWKIREFLTENDLFNQSQHGFRAGRSCLSQLLNHYQKILEGLCSGSDVDIVYLDFAKAFDKVDHGILIQKLDAIGIRGSILSWIREFLVNRTQSVVVDGAVSSHSAVMSGVPQGTVLGPVLFLIHIGNITDAIQHSQVASFADDTRILKSVNNIEDCELLQQDLRRIYDWAQETNMSFNENKFELIRYKRIQEPVEFTYMGPDNTPIERKDTVVDLGVTMSADASFREQVQKVASTGRQRAGWIMRVFSTREIKPMMTLYRALVLPVLEYCCQLWSPVVLKYVRQLEAVQRTFTWRLAEISHLDYWQRLEELKLYSLERRRERYIVIYVWKIIQGCVPNLEGGDRITTRNTGRRGRLCRVPPLSSQTRGRIQTLRDDSFAVLGPRLFNCLPRELRAYEDDLDCFKAQLDSFLATVPDKPTLPHYYQAASTNSLLSQVDQIELGR